MPSHTGGLKSWTVFSHAHQLINFYLLDEPLQNSAFYPKLRDNTREYHSLCN